MAVVSNSEISSIVRSAMASVRADVAAGRGPEIEPDAVAMHIAYGLADLFSYDRKFNRQAFLAACDVLDPIPSEAFSTW